MGRNISAMTACRLCRAPLTETFADLGISPLANDFVAADDRRAAEATYPLRAMVCSSCLLVQVEELASAEEIFSDYTYFSSFSTTWLDHARRFADESIVRFGLGPDSRVVEIASNDGYLLQYFKAAGIPVLGIEPAANVAKVAVQNGVPTLTEFFGEATAKGIDPEWQADLLVANNVMPHVPDLHDFVSGYPILLKPTGVVSIEFQHLGKLIDEQAFDTIYHEHFSYFSYLTARRALEDHGLRAFDVEELPTHGGSLRVYGCHADAPYEETSRSKALVARERAAGLDGIEAHRAFEETVRRSKRQMLRFLFDLKDQGQSIVAYGAPAKGVTLVNYCGIGRDLIDFAVDLNPVKQGTFVPGTQIEVRPPSAIDEARPDIVLILPWNLTHEIAAQLAHIREWGGRFVTRTPDFTLID